MFYLACCVILSKVWSLARNCFIAFVGLVWKMAAKKGIFIIGAKRTPFCKYGGSLREWPASKAFAAAAKDAINAANIDPNVVDNTVIGNAFFLSQCDGGKTARYCGIYSGVPIERPALCVNKYWGSGIQAVINGALDIITGMSKMTLTGGTEVMSSLPMLVRNVRFGTSLGQSLLLEDLIKRQLVDSYSGVSLQGMAEDIAVKYGISREDVDDFAWKSHLKWKAAQEAKLFESEITPITVQNKKKEVLIKSDEVAEISSVNDLAKLAPVLENGCVVTEGNSSMPADGASAILLADEDTCNQFGVNPLARVTRWVSRGAGDGAVADAVKAVAGEKLKEIDLFEINETFASETLAVIKLLGLDAAKVNANGGALTIGNPVAATGARMITHVAHRMRNNDVKSCIVASSCGGNQGVAILLERP